MIWPEFLNGNGQVIEDITPGSISYKGRANMWILFEEMREFHRKRIKVGTKGYWVQGPFKVASVTVIKLG